MPWCRILKSQTSVFLPSSAAATSGLVSLAAPVPREKCLSALRNVHNSQMSTLVNLPAVTILQIIWYQCQKIKERHVNPHSFSTGRGMFHMPCYRMISKDLKLPLLREGAQILLTFLPRSMWVIWGEAKFPLFFYILCTGTRLTLTYVYRKEIK